MDDKKRIMDLVKEGRISVEEALRLIEAMGTDKPGSKTPPPSAPASPGYAYTTVTTSQPAHRGIAKMIRIVIDGEDVRLKVNVPASLAKFAANFIPPEAKAQINAQGIDLAGILDMLKGDLPEGKLVDIEINDMAKMSGGESRMSGPMKVMIEVL
ncbi:MAG: hypothetical protein SFU83_03595 [Meiothermus sp.]|nr:hypothetical protein [Meiothermus sp.]